ncbi:MAG: pyridoxamine 5'-phosphate oxidase family protein [Candidatus Micrarchaeota archaeon]|nr:pyridoxamine 5'-phosphate oxidase family protein [Candidatus Micrarchaeota archaeon]
MPAKIEENYRELLKECLDSTIVATLATAGENGVWSAPIFFTYDKDFNIYFISNKATRHVENIRFNPNIALSAFTPIHSESEPLIGIQMRGIAAEVPAEKIQEVYDSRARRITHMTTFSRSGIGASLVKAHDGVFVQIKTASISYVNTKVFGGNIIEVSLNEL